MRERTDDISGYIKDREHIANSYVMRCFSVTMIVFAITFVLNLLNIFVIEQKLMLCAFIPSLVIYLIMCIVEKKISSSNWFKKYLILFSIILVFTIMGVFITYHVVLAALLPFLYATLYSSKKVMWYVYGLTVLSTVIIVYVGYYFGLCDANMALLTAGSLSGYVKDGQFLLTQVNTNPMVTLMLFFVIPRCLTYVAFIFVCSNIFRIISESTERARLSEELQIAKTEAENANRAKSQFLARVSHEIRTPINAVIGMNEMILRESNEEQIRKYADDVKDSSVVLLNIINELLDSSKIEAGKMELMIGNYEIGSLLNDVYNMTGIKAKEKNLELEFDVDSSIPCGYLGDDKRIRQILLNLLSNAVKYTEKGKVTLSVNCRRKGGQAVLYYSVKDTGIGIREEDIGKLYEAFERFDVERNRNVEGTGLGMNIAQQLLKLMGSELKIQSEYEKGTEFSFELLQDVTNEQPLGDFRDRLKKAQRREGDRHGFRAPSAKVLVVDDSKINLKVFKGLLKETQMQITEAESGEVCLQLLEKESFDLIFLDHMMPGLDGIETFRIMREKELCKQIPVIMLTANAIVGDRERYMEEGFDDFLTKPIIPEKLERMILRHLPEHMVEESDESEGTLDEHISVDPQKVLMLLEKKLPELDLKTALSCCGGATEFYLELLGDFVKIPIKEELWMLMHNGNHKGYHVRIHGFKNSAYLIGAMRLGDLSLELEKMSEEGISEELQQLQAFFDEQYDRICEQFKETLAVCENEEN